jgi:RNA polymerase-interacting CarD/CdnL/TRCF family regulator
MSFAVNDRVVYPKQGVCRVTAVEPMEVAGQRLTFVTLKREEDGSIVRVPLTKVQSVGVRKVADRAEVQALFEFLRADTDRADLDWKQRARTNQDRMTTGGLAGLAEVVKGLAVLSELRPLPTKERELYDDARHLLVAELSAAMDMSPCNAEDAVDVILFPPGRERPKRTAEEFKQRADADGLDLDDELLGLDTDLDLPPDEEAPAEEAPEEEAAEGGDEEGGDEEGEEEAAAKKRGRPPKAKAAAAADAEPAAPKKRGRPPKPKPEVEAEPAAPKKRGRPPKPKPEVEAEAAAPKKRGRPPKAKADEGAAEAAAPAAKKKKK